MRGPQFHQFDNFENDDRPWVASSGGGFHDRISCFLAFKNMRKDRHDRREVALISNGGGFIVSPDIRHRCSYGDECVLPRLAADDEL